MMNDAVSTRQNIQALSPETHDKVWLLLPWFVNETLPDDESMLVSQHLKVCVACRGEYEAQKRLRHAVCDSKTEDVCEQLQFHKLLDRIHAEPQPRTGIRESWSPHRRLYTGALAAVIFLMMLLPFTGLFDAAESQSYRTLSAMPIMGTGVQPDDVRIIFEDVLDANQRQQLLRDLRAHVVRQADAHGVYLVRLAGYEAMSSQQKARMLEKIRKYPGIVFAEPSITVNP